MSEAGRDSGGAHKAHRKRARSSSHPALDPTSALALLVTYPARLWLASLTSAHLRHSHAAAIHYHEPRSDGYPLPVESPQQQLPPSVDHGHSAS